MNDDTRCEHVTRENIQMLLSDDEIARVSTAEATTRPLEGEEYLDLEDLDQGIRSARATNPPMNRLVLRRSVHERTWAKIREELAAFHMAKTSSQA